VLEWSVWPPLRAFWFHSKLSLPSLLATAANHRIFLTYKQTSSDLLTSTSCLSSSTSKEIHIPWTHPKLTNVTQYLSKSLYYCRVQPTRIPGSTSQTTSVSQSHLISETAEQFIQRIMVICFSILTQCILTVYSHFLWHLVLFYMYFCQFFILSLVQAFSLGS